MATEDLKPLADCVSLDAIEMQNLPNVTSLGILGDSPARLLNLEGLTLDTLEPLAHWPRLQNLLLGNTMIRDQRISPLLRCVVLRHVTVGHERRNVFPDEDVRAFMDAFEADSFWYLNRYSKGTRLVGTFWQVVAQTRGDADAV